MRKRDIFRGILVCGLVSMLAACSDQWEGEGEEKAGSEGMPVVFSIESRAVDDGLQYEMYVFRKSTEEPDYRYERTLSLNASGQDTIRLMNSDLQHYSYRFLFTATPRKRPEITVKGKGETVLGNSSEWGEISITAVEDSLTAENYYGILDRQGTELLETGKIDGILTRLVGQFVFDFSKIGTDIDNPVDINTDKSVTSVLDRVYRIDILYRGLSKGVSLGTDLIPSSVERSTTILRSVFLQMDANLGIPVPQTERGLEIAASQVKGSARILGAYALPSSDVSVELYFYYYDTTPICENNHGSTPHGLSCYKNRNLSLKLTDKSSGTGLSILPDHYTLNRAGIHCDRIIDIGTTTGITVDTKWKNASK